MLRYMYLVCILSTYISLSYQYDTVFGDHEYIEYQVGGANSGIILTAPHGGTETPSSISDRPAAGCYDNTEKECTYTPNCGNIDTSECEAKTSTDTNTHKLAKELADKIKAKLGGTDINRPHVIINNLHRSKMDANRDLQEATFGDPIATKAWYEFHQFVDDAKKNATSGGRTVLYVDIHGQNRPENWTMIGFLLPKDGKNGISKTHIPDRVAQYSSIMQLHVDSNKTMEDLVRGPHSIGTLLHNSNYASVPSAQNKNAGTAYYYSGGYNLRRHTGWLVSGFQAEVHYNWRKYTTDRVAFADALAEAIIYWVQNYL